MSISSLVLDLWQFPFIRDWPEIQKLKVPPSQFFPRSGDKDESKYQNSFNLKFELVSIDQVIKFIDEIDFNKSSSGDIPAKIMKIAKEEIAESIRNYITSSMSTGTFPD